MAKNGIRLQYSGFVIFAAKLLSIASGLIFQILVAQYTRPFPEQFDIWFNIGDVLAYFTLLAGVAPFWVMRYVARGKEGAGKTGFVTNLIFSIVGTTVYLISAPFILSAWNISFNYLPVYLIASLEIIELYTMMLFEGSLQASKPQTIGYGLLLQQTAKVALGIVLITQTGQPLLGAIVSTVTAYSIQVAYYYKRLAYQFKEKIQWGYTKEWLKASTISIYNVIGNQIAAYVLIILFNFGGDGGRARYGAAFQITNVISYSSFLAFALYPKLLAEKNREDITTSLKMVLMFAVPMVAVAISLANLYITILRPEFADAAIVLVVLAIDTLFGVISGLLCSVAYGCENVDQSGRTSLKNLLKSRLFIVFSLPYFNAAISLPLTAYALTTSAFNHPAQAALSISIINTIAHFVGLTILVVVVRKMIRIEVPWRSIAKYVFAAAVVGTVLFLLPHPAAPAVTAALGIETETVIYIAEIVALTAVGGAFYMAILMIIDKETRTLPKAILREIFGKKNKNNLATIQSGES